MMQTAQRRGGSSAFDEAIAKPLLQAPTETKGNQHLLHRQAVSSSSSSSHRRSPQQQQSTQHPSFFQESINRNNASISHYRPPPPTSTERKDMNAMRQQQMLIVEEQELQGTDLEEALLHERHGDFVSIRGDMQQINNIYKDLAHVVEAQQEHFDDMEMNLLNTEQNAEEGMKQLHSAAGLSLSQSVNDRFIRLGSGIFVAVAFVMLVYMFCR